MKTQWQYNCSM